MTSSRRLIACASSAKDCSRPTPKLATLVEPQTAPIHEFARQPVLFYDLLEQPQHLVGREHRGRAPILPRLRVAREIAQLQPQRVACDIHQRIFRLMLRFVRIRRLLRGHPREERLHIRRSPLLRTLFAAEQKKLPRPVGVGLRGAVAVTFHGDHFGDFVSEPGHGDRDNGRGPTICSAKIPDILRRVGFAFAVRETVILRPACHASMRPRLRA